MTLLAEVKVQGSRESGRGSAPRQMAVGNRISLTPFLHVTRSALPSLWGGISVSVGECKLGTGSTQTRKLILGIAVSSFAIELLLSEAWLRLARSGTVLAILSGRGDPAVSVAAGLLLGLLVALASRLLFSTFGHRLTEELFIPVFGCLYYRDAVAISLLPAFGEEILFRGVMQPELGLLATSLVFGLMHSGLSRKLLPYGLWAAVVGALLGALYLWSGSLYGPVAAHALVNAAGIVWLKRLAV